MVEHAQASSSALAKGSSISWRRLSRCRLRHSWPSWSGPRRCGAS